MHQADLSASFVSYVALADTFALPVLLGKTAL